LGKPLSQSGEAFKRLYFPQKGMISLVRPMPDGATIEVGVIGREGFVGMCAVLGGEITIPGSMVQVSGSALTIPMGVMRQELDHYPILKAQLLRCIQALLSQAAQSTVCNGRHHIQERLACWLLMTRDHAEDHSMTLHHEFLSIMLGVRRAGITVTLGKSRNAGLIRYDHGTIETLDRAGLEGVSCECYGEVSAEHKRLLQ
jgi:CRP-like cAMP-binding protein